MTREALLERTPSAAGRLVLGASALPVDVAVASRISLWARFPSRPPPADRAEFDHLVLMAGDREVTLSRCRLYAERVPGFDGRLVFLDDVYDFRALAQDGDFVNLKGFFHNLPLVLSQKEGIRPEFKDWVGSALYDISVFKRFFDEQDRVLREEPAHVAEAARDALIRTEGPRFTALLSRQIDELRDMVRGYTKEEYERHGFYLRRKAWPFILGSAIHKRTNLKPRGYAGDAEMMRLIYENAYDGHYVFNQLLHKFAVELPAAQAVRNRRRYVPRVLRDLLPRFADLPPHGFRFLSLASGPAWELQDVFLDAEDHRRFDCALLDQDTEALDSARAAVARIEAASGLPIRVEYVNESVRTMMRTSDLPARFGRFHFIYSMGLFDYLTPPVAKAVLEKVFELLVPGGVLAVGNFHEANPTRVYMDYWLDWPLFYRTEESFLALTTALPATRRAITFDDTGCQMFLHLERPG